MHGRAFLLAFALAPFLAGTGGAASFQITLAGQTTGFTAPATGGPVSDLLVTLGEVSFDTPVAGPTAPTYDPVDNDINGVDGALFGYMTNSAATGTCAAGDCLLEFEDAEADAPPKLWAAFSEVDGIFDEFLGAGEYAIVPGETSGGPDGVVPLPAAGGLLAVGFGLLALTRRRRPLA